MPIRFTAGPSGLTVRAQSGDSAVEYRDPEPRESGEVTCTLRDLADSDASRPISLSLELRGNQFIAHWYDRGVPQLHQGDVPATTPLEDFPPTPETWAENPPELHAALDAACETCDETSSRYALHTVQFQGVRGALVATDGKQVLRQQGFQFGFDDDVLVRRSTVFGCHDLPHDQSVRVGRLDTHVVFSVGPWTIWLPIEKEQRFPRVEEIIPPPESASQVLELSTSDCAFLAPMLSRLPAHGEPNQPLTIDLGDVVAIRARADDQQHATEFVLSQSRYQGEPIRLCMNRVYLQRAVSLGLDRIHFFGTEDPAMACDERRLLVWALLEPNAIVKPADDHVRIESPSADRACSAPHNHIPSRSHRSMPSSPASSTISPDDSHANGAQETKSPAERRPRAPKPSNAPHSKPIQVAQAIRTALRDALSSANELVRTLQQHKRQSQLVRQTLASLKQLSDVA